MTRAIGARQGELNQHAIVNDVAEEGVNGGGTLEKMKEMYKILSAKKAEEVVEKVEEKEMGNDEPDFNVGDRVFYTERNGEQRSARIISISYEGIPTGEPPDVLIKFTDGSERSTIFEKLSTWNFCEIDEVD